MDDISSSKYTQSSDTPNSDPHSLSTKSAPVIPTQSSNSSYQSPTQSSNSSSNISKSPTSVNIFKVVIIIIIAFFTLAISVSTYIGYKYLSPRIKIASAISNLTQADSFIVDLELLFKEEYKFTSTASYQADPALFEKRVISINIPITDTEIATFSESTIRNQNEGYVKFHHSNMNQMYNYLLTIAPGFSDNPDFKAIEPMLHDESWLQLKESQLPTTSSMPRMTVPQVLMALIGFTILESQSAIVIDGSNYSSYKLGMNSIAIQGLVSIIREMNSDLTVSQVNGVAHMLDDHKYLQELYLTLLIDEEQNVIRSFELHFPSLMISELLQKDKTLSQKESIGEVLSSPLTLIGWLDPDTNEAQVKLSFKDVNQVSSQTAPSAVIVPIDSRRTHEIAGYIYYSFSNSDFVTKAAGSENAYITLTHETRLLFNQGSYSEGLTKANQALEQADTEEHRAYAHYWIGLHYHKLGNNQDAESHLLTALSLKADYAAPYVTLGSISLEKSNYQQMLEYSRKCVDLDQNYAWCHNNLGIALVSLGQKQAGISSIEKAVSLDPTSFVFNDNLKRARESQ